MATPLPLAVIPARGGSQRVPGKNVRNLAGRPAIAYTIAAALESGVFDRVVVSTDSEEIAQVARSSGAEVPFLRDAQLADAVTPISLVTLDALDRVDPQQRYDAVAQLMANCPLRTANDIRASYNQFRNTGAAAQISVTPFAFMNPWWAVTLDDKKRMKNILPDTVNVRSQDLPALFCPTGAVWWSTAESLRRERTFHIPEKTAWIMPWERAVDIDTKEDWALAELLIKSQFNEGEND